jgi:hypothetical protein
LQTLWCAACRAHRDEMERLWVVVYGDQPKRRGGA